MQTYSLLIAAMFLAALDCIAVARNWKRTEMLVKPAVIIALIAWVWHVDGFTGWMAWIGIGLIFSLLGDVLLLWAEKLFVPGLVAFLLTHIAYTIALNPTFPPVTIVTALLFAAVAVTGIPLFWQMAASLRQSGNTKMILPALVYAVAISLMAFSAVATLVRPEWSAVPALLVSLGALSFMASDLLLAWERFVKSVPNSRLIVMITYYVAQIAIVLGAAWQYLPL